MKTLLVGIAFAMEWFLLPKLWLCRTARVARGNTVITSAPVMTNKRPCCGREHSVKRS